jgi:hypothetical protein
MFVFFAKISFFIFFLSFFLYMEGDSPGPVISVEQPSGETSRMGRQAMERETRAVKHSSKRKESPAEVEQPRNRTRVTVSSQTTHAVHTSQTEASHCISVSRSWPIKMDLHEQQRHSSRGQPRGRTTMTLLPMGGAVKTDEVREAVMMTAPQETVSAHTLFINSTRGVQGHNENGNTMWQRPPQEQEKSGGIGGDV